MLFYPLVLSDLLIDSSTMLPRKVLKKLHRLFQGFDPVQPTLFVLIGNFLSKPFGHGHWRLHVLILMHLYLNVAIRTGLDDVKRMRKAFDDLSDILIQFPRY